MKGCRGCVFAKQYDISTHFDDHQTRIECNMDGRRLFQGSDKYFTWLNVSDVRPADCPLSIIEDEENDNYRMIE